MTKRMSPVLAPCLIHRCPRVSVQVESGSYQKQYQHMAGPPWREIMIIKETAEWVLNHMSFMSATCALGEILLECSSTPVWIKQRCLLLCRGSPGGNCSARENGMFLNVFHGGLPSQRRGPPEGSLSSKHIWSLGHLPEHTFRHLPVYAMAGNLHVKNGETGR